MRTTALDCFLPSRASVDRRESLEDLKSCIGSLVNRTLKIADVDFIDSRFADFYGLDRSGEVYGVGWIGAGEFETRLFGLLQDYQSLIEIAPKLHRRHFPDSPDAPIGVKLVLASEVMPERWLRIAAALNVPVFFVRVHRIRSAGDGRDACYFELEGPIRDRDKPGEYREAARSRDAAPAPGSAAETPARDREQPPASPGRSSEPSHLAPSSIDPEPVGSDPPPDSEETLVKATPHAGSTEPEPRMAAASPTRAEKIDDHLLSPEANPHAGLSSAEIASFRVLEKILKRSKDDSPD